MKEDALRHLMHARMRKIVERAPADFVVAMRVIQRSLRIDGGPGGYELSWTHDGKTHRVAVPRDTFAFYLTGDTVGSVTKRDPTRRLRDENWSAARALWHRIASLSGLPWPTEQNERDLGLRPDDPRDVRVEVLAVAVPAAGAGLLAFVVFEPLAALATTALATLLAGWLFSMRDVQAHQAASVGEALVVVTGALVPAAMGSSAGAAALLASGPVVAMYAEARGPTGTHVLWVLAGLLTGSSVAIHGFSGVVAALLLTTGVVLLAAVAPSRITTRQAIAFACSTIAAGAVAWLSSRYALPAVPSTAVTALASITACVCIAVWGTGWVTGSLFRVVPWLAFGTVGLVGLMLDHDARAPLASFAGMAFVGLLRVLRGWIPASPAAPDARPVR